MDKEILKADSIMENLSETIYSCVISEDNIEAFISENMWLDEISFKSICDRYNFPTNKLTVVIEEHYVDAVYRDAYYNYWSRTHFDWPRFCRRIFLFLGFHSKEEFYGSEGYKSLDSDFLGAIVVRPSYSNTTDHTFGRTLLNPYKMKFFDENGKQENPDNSKYLETAVYRFHLIGHTYSTRAFPFLSQDGIVMKCAETSVCVLCDYASANFPQYAKILPSSIQAKLRERLPERVLPSHGLYCNDISYLLGAFGFSPMIYAESGDCERTEKTQEKENSSKNENASMLTWDNQHKTSFKNWFHYYIESAIPILMITAPSQDVNKHATLAIGHSNKRNSLKDIKKKFLGDLPCIDTSELYSCYIIQDDNQIPYTIEEMDKFTQKKNFKLEAFIVPLERHVFLDALSAINICDAFIEQEKDMIKNAINDIKEKYIQERNNTCDDNKRQQFDVLIKRTKPSEQNPIVVRYFLANSASYKEHRISNADSNDDRIFYANVPMPKAVWVAEISIFNLYELGYVFAEVVIDATASNRSKVNSILLLRIANFGVYRFPQETYDAFNDKIKKNKCDKDLKPIFSQFSNFYSEENNGAYVNI